MLLFKLIVLEIFLVNGVCASYFFSSQLPQLICITKDFDKCTTKEKLKKSQGTIYQN